MCLAFPHFSNGLSDSVQGIAVAGTTEVRQPAGEREPTRIVGRQPELVAHGENRKWETAVEVEGRHVVDTDAGDPERFCHSLFRRDG